MCRRNGRGKREKDRSCNPEKPRQAQIVKPLEAGDGDDVWNIERLGQPPLFTLPLPGKPDPTACLVGHSARTS